MKAGIHPSYKQATITCACGSVVVTRSTRGSFTTDVCSQCHPFYTGKHKIMDVAGRVDRFRRKYASTQPAVIAPAVATPPAAAKPSA
jgi:large subunit ribosomal protein L31